MTTSKPNILIIYTDQQRYDTINALGADWMQTPNLDRLAGEGTSFTQATTPCPVCMSARWSLHTGQWTSTHKCYSNHHAGPHPGYSLPGILRNNGYRTGLIGKNHSFLTPDDLDTWNENPYPSSPLRGEDTGGADISLHPHFPLPNSDFRLRRSPIPGDLRSNSEHAKTNAALDFMSQDSNKPFFLWLSYLYPHTPYEAPEPYFSMYADKDIPGPVMEPDGLEAAGKPFRQIFHRDNNNAVLPYSKDDIMRMRKIYYGMISLIDREVGRILDYLDTNGLRENTLIIFTSDHGDYMGDHGLITKSPSLYDCLTRIPCIVSQPGTVRENVKSDINISAVDIMPTVLSQVGLKIPEQVQGIDASPWLTGNQDENIREAGFAEYGIPGEAYTAEKLKQENIKPGDYTNPWHEGIPWEGNPVSLAGRIRMVRTKEWKCIEDANGQNELYDLQNDPGELVNLYKNPSYQIIQTEMISEMERTITSIKRET